MFDLSWGEMLLVGAVALIVIGPKDLPRTLRAVGQVVGKARRMASEFQGQFNQAMREAELDQVRKEVEGMGRVAKAGLNPAKAARDEIKRAVEGERETEGAAAASGSKPSLEKKASADSGAGPVDLAKPRDAEPGDAAPRAAAAGSAGDDPGAEAAEQPPPAAPPVAEPVGMPVPTGEREEAKP